MATLNAKSYELLSASSSVFPWASPLPVYTTCIFRCRFTSVKKENKHTHTHTRTATPLCGYAYALCKTKIVQQGRGEGAKCNACSAIWNATIIRSVVRRGMPDVRNAQVPLESSSSSSAAATSTPSSSVPHLLPSSLPPSLLPSPLSFHYFAQISSYIKKKELGLPYTAHIRIYMTGSICLLQLTAA